MTMRVISAPGNRTVFIQLEETTRKIKGSIRQALYEIGAENKQYAKYKIYKRKTGRIYIIDGAFHQASAPGEFPANLSGKLAQNVDFRVRGSSQMEFGDKRYPTGVPVGKFLEFGTVKMLPRPHISQTVKERYRNAENSLREAFKRAIL